MKRAFAILMIFACLIESFREGVVYAVFELNREYITKYVCIERAQRNNCCQGTCYLSKKLEDAGDNDDNKTLLRFWERGADLYISYVFSGYLFLSPGTVLHSRGTYLPDSPGYSFQLHTRIFRPPQEQAA